MNKILLCAAALVALLYSCEEDTYERISRKDWTKLQVGDTLYFRSSAHVDTFLIGSITNDYDTQDKIYHTEYLEIYYRKLNIETEIDTLHSSWFGTRRFTGGATIHWKRFDEMCTSYYTIDTSLNIGSIKLDEVVVVPERYIDVYSLSDTKTIYYCNRYGVVQYKLFSGETFTIDSNYLQKIAERKE